MSEDDDDLASKNKQAWDELYGRTSELVWGRTPIGFIEQFLPDARATLNADSRILDAGTGEGRNLKSLAQLPGRIHACDASAHALEKIDPAIRDHVELRVCDLSELPYPDDFFDFVLITDVIETLPNQNQALSELHRVLKPGGLLLCNIPGIEDEISAIDMVPIGANRYLFNGKYFYQFFSEEEAIALLRSNGFEPVRNEICKWGEDAHPEFRGEQHVHTSRVFLARTSKADDSRTAAN